MKMRHALVATAMALCLAAAACGNDSGDSGNDGSGTASGGSLTLSGQDFTEVQIMAAMYNQLLTNAGYDVTEKLVGTRDIYLPQLESGDVDVVPEYLSSLADALNVAKNGQIGRAHV